MTSRSDLVALWGEDGVVPVDLAVLDCVALPADTTDFLAKVGLPRSVPHLFTSVVDRRIARSDPDLDCAEGETLVAAVTLEGETLLRLGSYYGGYFLCSSGFRSRCGVTGTARNDRPSG